MGCSIRTVISLRDEEVLEIVTIQTMIEQPTAKTRNRDQAIKLDKSRSIVREKSLYAIRFSTFVIDNLYSPYNGI